MLPWQPFSGGAIPGVGSYETNLSNGNMILGWTDVDIPERGGLDLQITHVYNSALFAQRDWNGQSASDDGGEQPGQLGQGFTSSIDAHLALNSNGGITVFDGSETRIDYTMPVPNACVDGPPGIHATLCDDGGYGYFWMFSDDSWYHFYTPVTSKLPSDETALAGRIYMIAGRNWTASELTFTYSWTVPSATDSSDLAQITISHSDGQNLVLNYSPNANWVSGNGTAQGTLLTSIQRPGDASPTIFYVYDQYNDLTEVDLPSNGNGVSRAVTIGYNGPGQVSWVASPRCTATLVSGGSCSDGGYTNFIYSVAGGGNGTLLTVYQDGLGNFIPNDSTVAPLQSGPTGIQNISTIQYTYNTGSTSVSDRDGHAQTTYFDSLGRPTETDAYPQPGTQPDYYLKTTASWDASNNLVQTTDARGQPTDRAYDGNGNLTEIAGPPQSPGGTRPTQTMSYDQYGNVTASCDPAYNGSHGTSWTTNPGVTGDALCANAAGSAQYSYYYGYASEPAGMLAYVTTPNGYQYTLGYNNTNEGGDYGLPTDVTGASISQNDNTVVAPGAHMVYDPYGNVICWSSHANSAGNWARATYNSRNQVTAIADADSNAIQQAACPMSAPYASGETTITYNPDGSVAQTQTPSELASNVGSVATYDDDDNLIDQTSHFASTNPAHTVRWYDGEDRLVEVQLPHDAAHDLFASWLTRYIYDISESGNGGPFHGNLLAVERYVPGLQQTGTSVSQAYQWYESKTWQYDSLDRVVQSFAHQPGASVAIGSAPNTWIYDGNYPGLLESYTNAAGDSVTYQYDNAGEVSQRTFSDGSNPIYAGSLPTTDQTTYDLDGRVSEVNTSELGPIFYTYDSDGNVLTYKEPTGGGGFSQIGVNGAVDNPATYTYSYYADDEPKQMALTSSALMNYSEQWNYYNDGLIHTDVMSSFSYVYGGQPFVVPGITRTQTFSSAGRIVSKSDPSATPSLTVTYDPYERISSWVIPEGAYSNFSYDPEGEVTLFDAGSQAYVAGYSVRGELLTEGQPGINSHSIADFSPAAGFLYNNSASCHYIAGTEKCFGDPQKFDTLTSTLLAAGNVAFSYDAAGRRSNRLYDALNRVLDYSSTGPAYGYAAGSLPLRMGAATNHASMGMAASYSTSDAQGTWGELLNVNQGQNVDFTPNTTVSTGYVGQTYFDRDPWGFVAGARNSTGMSGWNFPNFFSGCESIDSGNLAQPTSGFQGTAMTACNPNGLPYAYRTDGYFDGTLSFHGVRTYDSDTQQWSTPDFYGGTAGNPMSGLAYNYAGNNPATFVDASGFDSSAPTGDPCSSGGGIGGYVFNGDNWEADCTFFGDGGGSGDYWFIGASAQAFGSAHSPGMYGSICLPCLISALSRSKIWGSATCGVWSAEFQAGAQNQANATAVGTLAIGLYYQAFITQAWRDIGWYGKFDYQRSTGQFNKSLEDITNFGVGVYFAGAGWDEPSMDAANSMILRYASKDPGLIARDKVQWESGWAWATKICAHG